MSQNQVERISQLRGAFQFPIQGKKTSIQNFFENRIKQIRDGVLETGNVRGDFQRLSNDMNMLNESTEAFLENNSEKIKTKDLLRRSDINEAGERLH